MNPQAQPGFAAAATYDPAVALEFFKSAGKPAAIGEGEKIFAENERAIPLVRRNKMYLLLKGEVGLVSGGRSIGRVRPGEIFGEMALISHAPRSATIQAEVASILYVLSAHQFEIIRNENPALGQKLLTYFVTVMAERLTFANRTIAVLRR